MNVTVTAARLSEVQADALILGVPAGQALPDGPLKEADAALGGALGRVLGDQQFTGKSDQVEVLYPMVGLGAPRVVLLGLGDKPLDAEGWRKAVSTAVGAVSGKARSVALLLPAGMDPAMAAEAASESAILSAYEFHPYQTEKDEDDTDRKLETLTLIASDEATARAASARGVEMAETVSWVRDLSNMPGNKLVVSDLVREATQMAKAEGLSIRVMEFDELKREGFGCLVAVGQGSVHPPAFVVVEYQGGAAGEAPIGLVGKGITFDTGGINIKPRAGMEEMKTDMHGAATVLGTLKMAARRKLPVNLVGCLAIAENMPNGNAIKPGDIVKSYNGLTVEILDTDAEGRLVLADGLGYVVKNHQPRAVIDLATLTGSIIMALAYEATGLFTNNAELATQLKAAGEVTGERVWQFPTWDVYERMAKSDIADVRNVGKEKGDAIASAMFLKSFVGQTPWVHLDIAGSSFIPDAKPYRPKGSTGVGVRLLIEWLTQQTKR
ncbi:MAG: leucyl aminopeptidase [Candidatus Sericytochromatia bacterium]